MRNRRDIEADLKTHKIYLKNEQALIDQLNKELKDIDRTFTGGQWFRDNHGIMVLSQVDSGKYGLIYINDKANRSYEPYKVMDSFAITWGEIKIMSSNFWAGQPEPIDVTIQVK